jgi:rhamnulokinase
MTETANFLAVDLGASSGRVLLGRWDGSRFQLEEMHRFANGPVNVLGHLHWDVLRLWSEIQDGLARSASQIGAPLSGIGVDTWGVDFALLDRAGGLLGDPYHYRDGRTNGVPEQVFGKVSRDRIYQRTGIQFMQINTLFQLYSMVQAGDPQLEMADTLLMMPDLFHYWLTGQKAAEYTIASTSQMLDCQEQGWAVDMLAEVGIPASILPSLVPPGTVIGDIRPEVNDEIGLRQKVSVIAPGSHDTASAVAAIPELDGESVYISSGTWSLIGIEAAEPVINESALALNFTNERGVDGTVRLLRNMAGLWLLQESRRRWQVEGRPCTWDELLSLAERAAPFRSLVDPDAADFLSPGDMPAAIRSYCRRTGQPEPADVGAVVRCCLESLALKTRWVLEALESLVGRRLEVIRMVGGGSRNWLLCQFTADACERPVVAGPVEATALGNIMIQAISGGYLGNLSEGRQAVADSIERRTYEPRSGVSWQAAYDQLKGFL